MYKTLVLLAFLGFVSGTNLLAQSDLAKFIEHISKKNENGSKLKYEVKDEKNGFYKYCTLAAGDDDCSMESIIYEVAVWNLADGSKIYGYFQYYCGGEGCGGDLSDFHFFDAKYKDITEKVLPMKQLHDLVKKDFRSTDGQLIPREIERTYMMAIPQKSTTIDVSIGILGVGLNKVGSLTFDKKAGKFSFK